MAGRTRRTLTRSPAFWDTSALVPLCVRQRITPQVTAYYHAHEIVVWWSTPVEIASALARLKRMRQLDPADCAQAHRLAMALSDSWFLIRPSDALRTRAMQLVDQYDLRAADALQLSAALEWCEGAPRGRVFLTADQKLQAAAVLCGFSVLPI